MAQDVRVRHLRLHAEGGSNTVALRVGLEQSLRQARLSPPILPSSAILVIRQLRAASSYRLAAPTARQWSQDLEQQIAAIARRASRPSRQYVPSDAESVLFWDAAELLTCYTHDMLAGQERWYWHDLFDLLRRSDSTGTRLLTGWSAYPTAIPRMMIRLTPPQARQALASLSPRDLSTAIRLLHDQFALPETALPAQAADAIEESGGVEQPPAPPWQPWLPPQVSDILPPRAVYVLGLCHTLARQPHQARSPEFARRVAQWFEATAPRRANPEQPADSLEQPSMTGDESLSQTVRADAPQHEQAQFPAAESRAAPDTVTADDTVLTESAETQAEALANAVEGIETQLGGIFYLVNAVDWLLSVLLPGAVETINRWELVAALAYDLLGDAIAPYQDDPVWALLRDLAQIDPETRLGEALSRPARFCVAPEWLARWGMNALSCVADRHAGRLCVWAADAGFWLADAPDTDGALAALVALFEEANITLHWEFGDVALPAHVAVQQVAPELARWLGFVRPLLDFRIRFEAREQWPQCLAAPAVIQVTNTHIDVRIPLDQINVAVRRAGLDSDPGWQPAFGYIIYFHFE